MRKIIEVFKYSYGCPCCGDTQFTFEGVEIFYTPCGGIEKIIHFCYGCCADSTREIDIETYFKLRKELEVERVNNVKGR